MTDPWHAFESARDAYLAEHPALNVLDYACPRCKAEPGGSCRKPNDAISERFHIARQDRHARAFNQHQVAAVDAGDRAYDIALRAEGTTP